jgi:stage IV sporulation protein FB
MLVEPGRTNYDLRFRLFGTPVRVHPFFWLFAAILGWNLLQDAQENDGFIRIILWIIACFLSILLHEFGHIWMGMLFGARDGYIVLYSFGGLAVGANDLRGRWRRIAVSLAGPLIQLALFGGFWLVLWLSSADWIRHLPARVRFFLGQMLYINLVWPLFNLLPVWPLDGGQISREVCNGFSPRSGVRFSLGLSIGVAALLAINGLVGYSWGQGFLPYIPADEFTAILFGLLALQSYQLLQQVPSWRYEPPDDRLPWESDSEAWKK